MDLTQLMANSLEHRVYLAFLLELEGIACWHRPPPSAARPEGTWRAEWGYLLSVEVPGKGKAFHFI